MEDEEDFDDDDDYGVTKERRLSRIRAKQSRGNKNLYQEQRLKPIKSSPPRVRLNLQDYLSDEDEDDYFFFSEN